MYKNTEDIKNEVVVGKMNDYNLKSHEIDMCEKNICELKKTVKMLNGCEIGFDSEKLEQVINTNHETINDLKVERNLIGDEIERIQRECEHEMVYYGHDSHYDYYRCSKCGFEDRW